MVKKIPKDHMGLYACEPINHGIQSQMDKKVFHDTLHKEGCREVKTYYPLCKKEKMKMKTKEKREWYEEMYALGYMTRIEYEELGEKEK